MQRSWGDIRAWSPGHQGEMIAGRGHVPQLLAASAFLSRVLGRGSNRDHMDHVDDEHGGLWPCTDHGLGTAKWGKPLPQVLASCCSLEQERCGVNETGQVI